MYKQQKFPTPPSDETGGASARPKRVRIAVDPQVQKLRDALAPYVNLRQLRTLVSEGGDIRASLLVDVVPQEVTDTLHVLSVMLHPTERAQIKSPHDVAALLMVEMGHLTQEEVRVVLLDTKNRVQDIVTVYKGTVNTVTIRVTELFTPANRVNATAILLIHNHPSGDPTPSCEDILMTRNAVEAGKLLDIDVLDRAPCNAVCC